MNKPLPTLRPSIALAIVAVLIGSAEFAPMPRQFFGAIAIPSVYAQSEVSNDEINRYAEAAFKIEQRRQEVQREIKDMTGGKVPNLACDDPNTLNAASRNVRRLFVEFCEESRAIVAESGLEVSRFNEIHSLVASDPNLQQRVQARLLQLQQQSERN
ncbi:MAG: DUF4168 domain-containing protein [Coleofasciculaceae cyanobacterium SM2_3_26]|nr:DUF4168 domain-containing protein [Coleofasciculaceae cyanobacterium SM2_3_26]